MRTYFKKIVYIKFIRKIIKISKLTSNLVTSSSKLAPNLVSKGSKLAPNFDNF